jgi:hypothetical protein
MSETGEEVQDKSLAFDDNLNFDADNIKIEEGNHVFMAIAHLVDPHHFFVLQAWCLDIWPKLLQRTQRQRDFITWSPQHLTMKMCLVKQLLTLSLNIESGIMP